MKQALGIVFLVCFSSLIYSQNPSFIRGHVTDENGDYLPGATIVNLGSKKGISADNNGDFRIEVIPNRKIALEISYIGFRKDTLYAEVRTGEVFEITIKLQSLPKQVGEVIVESWLDRAEALQQISIKSLDRIPLPSGNLESLLTSMGASSRNEMSSQYSVRGGNFDENLIYVNGIEIYRPMLVKAGQQEGMSFINPSMVSSVQFTAGGFDARYGDKMSSVLDIRYKKPVKYKGSVSASLLGLTAHFEGNGLKNRFTHITGIRYKSNQYLLNSMQTKGEFKPRFFDIQTYMTFLPIRNLEISFLGNMSVNTYNVIPESRETAFGTYQQPLNFVVYYEGQEKDRFATLLGALSVDYHYSDNLSLKFTGSGFNTYEKITYDILGQYRIDYLDKTPGSETAGDSILNLGYGGNLLHARNYLNADILSLTHTGSYRFSQNQFNWGIGVQREKFSDQIREWELIDSAGYSIPYSDQEIQLQHVVMSTNTLSSYRFSAYVNNITTFPSGNSEIFINTGLRLGYLNTNSQVIFSPRMNIYLIPDWENKFSFHLSVGWYHQPPFYKEMIDPSGNLHTNVKAQQSVHFLLGSALDFALWERPFKFTGEAYFKKLDHLIPYVIDDVAIQYLPQYTARGYATGIEFKINGEFVKDAESWATLSFLQTYENRYNDAYGQYPRPTNQLVNFGFYFQDYFPNNPSYRVHLNMYYGSRLPYNSTQYDHPERYYHLQSYRRIDIGVSKSFMTDKNGQRLAGSKFLNDFRVSFEVFNLFDFKNQASYQWVKTVSNQEGIPNMFAIPNYLTGILVNLKLTMEF